MGIIDSVRSAAKSFGEKRGGFSAAIDKLKNLSETISEHRITNGIKAFSRHAFIENGARDKAIGLMDEISSLAREKTVAAKDLAIHGQTREQMNNEKLNKENEHKKTEDEFEK